MCMHAVLDVRRWFVSLMVGVIVLTVLAGEALAGDRYYVLRDGRKVPLAKSDSELGVVFRSHDEVEEARQRLEAAGYGIVEDIEDAPHARVKILRVTSMGDVALGDVEADESVEDVQPIYRFAGVESPVIPTGTVVLKLRSGLSAEQRESLWEEYGIGEVEMFRGLHGVYIVTPVNPDADDVLIAEQLADDYRTLWANPDFRMAARPTQEIPSDEYFGHQWHLHNTGESSGKVDADIDALEAWEITEGTGVLFGMFDQGCDVDHEDLRSNYIGVGQDIARPPFDDPRPKLWWDAHGTAVMGLAVAAGNSVGVRGVSYRARFTASRGVGEYVNTSAIASAFTFALDQGVDIHINSWGYLSFIPSPPVIVEAIERAFREGRDLDGEGGEDPLGMVIVFSTGNENTEIARGFSLAALPQVIGVGASTDSDSRSNFSNYGPDMNFVAPGAGEGSAGIATTDNEDGKESGADGYNVGGVSVDPESPWFAYGTDIDPDGKYTGTFGGTSASCPIAAGVAGLVLSVNPKLTATDVRIIMEHTCDQVSPDDAHYDGITNKSLTYGYGRINAERAVKAARDTLTSGGFTWPDVPTDVRVDGTTLRWKAGVGADEFLVIESMDDFDFAPEDDACYDNLQLGCSGVTPASLPNGSSVLYVGCEGLCDPGSEQSVDFKRPAVGSKLFAIYGRSASGRYSFGGIAEGSAVPPPAVTIAASPLGGSSPLTVRFNGNAVSQLGIDHSQTAWDFDVDDSITVDATTPAASFTYIVPSGEVRTFTARLTMVNVEGVVGFDELRIRVAGEGAIDGAGTTEGAEIRILISVPGTPGSDMPTGTSPFSVQMRIETDTPGSIESVVWDLGDGTRTKGLVVPHTYINEGSTTLVLPVTATVTTTTPGGAIVTDTVNRLITVYPGVVHINVGEPDLPGTRPLGEGGSAIGCGVIGMVPLLFCFASLMLLRRRRF